ncbi:riboflavin transporter Mch5p [[Candida] anglica]
MDDPHAKDIEGQVSNEPKLSVEPSEGSSGIEAFDDPDLFPEGGWVAYRVVIGCFVGFIGTLGFVNATGVIQTYVTTNILKDSPESDVGWIFSVYNFMAFGSTLVSGPVFDRVGARIPLLIGIVLQTVGFMCLSVSTEVYQFVLGYGILAGLGTSFTFAPFLGAISHFFLKKRAQAIGAAYMGGALGGIIFPLVFRSLFPKVGFGWGIRIGAFMVFGFLLIGFALIADRKEEIHAGHNYQSGGVIKQIVQSIDLTVFKDKIYTCLVLALLGNGFAFLISLTYIPSYAVANGVPQNSSYLLLVVFNAMSIPGRVIPGYYADKYGRFNMLCLIALLSTMAFCIIWIPPPIGHTLTGLYVFSGCYGFTSGSILSLAPACIGQICHTRDFGKRYGTAYFALSFGDLIGIPIGGAIIGSGNSVKGFDHLVIFITVLSAMGTIAAFSARYFYAGVKMIKV